MESTSSVISFLYNIKLVIPILLLAGYFLQAYLSYRRLSHISGPRYAAWSDLWLAVVARSRRSHLEYYEVSKKYGPLARIGPNVLLTSDIDLMHRMSAVRSPYTRSDWYRGIRFEPGKDHVFSMTDDKAHNKRRAQLSNAYLGKENIALEPSIDRNVVKLLDLIRRKYISSPSEFRGMDLAAKAQFFAMDVVMEIATGTPLGDLDNDTDMFDYLKNTAATIPVLQMVATVPTLMNTLQIPWLAKKLFPNAKDKVGFGKIIGLAKDKIQERFSSDKASQAEKSDMLQSFIRHGLNEEEAVSECLLQFIAGSDTTATALRVIMLHILTNPSVYTALRAEIDHVLSVPGQITRPVIRSIESRTLPYLQAIIREGLRIWPPAAGLASKLVPPGGDTINGVFVPGGTKIGGSYWAIVRNTDVFGTDAEIFRPERWLEAGEEERARMEKVQELVFGYGKYGCLGKGLATVELSKVIFELMSNFDWTVANPAHPWHYDCYAIFFFSDMWVRVTEREKDN